MRFVCALYASCMRIQWAIGGTINPSGLINRHTHENAKLVLVRAGSSKTPQLCQPRTPHAIATRLPYRHNVCIHYTSTSERDPFFF